MAAQMTEVNACSWCGQPERSHYNRWMPEWGWHQYHAPTDALRKARLIARRNTRHMMDGGPPEAFVWGRMHEIDPTMVQPLHYRLRGTLNAQRSSRRSRWGRWGRWGRIRYRIARWWNRGKVRQ